MLFELITEIDENELPFQSKMINSLKKLFYQNLAFQM